MTINKVLESKEKKEVTRSFWQAYLVIDPIRSKIFIWWQLILLVALQVQFMLFPYTVCFQIDVTLPVTQNLELLIDVIFVLNIVVNFLTSLELDIDVDRNLKHIAIAYIKDNLVFDIISTVPGFLLALNSYLYFFKIFRFKRFGTMKVILKKLIGTVGQKFS